MVMTMEQVTSPVLNTEHRKSHAAAKTYGQAGPVFLPVRSLSLVAQDLLSSPPLSARLTAYDDGWYSS